MRLDGQKYKILHSKSVAFSQSVKGLKSCFSSFNIIRMSRRKPHSINSVSNLRENPTSCLQCPSPGRSIAWTNHSTILSVKSIKDPLPFIAPGSHSQKNRKDPTGIVFPLPNAYQLPSSHPLIDHEKAIAVAYVA
jgi:hypothetical protein